MRPFIHQLSIFTFFGSKDITDISGPKIGPRGDVTHRWQHRIAGPRAGVLEVSEPRPACGFSFATLDQKRLWLWFHVNLSGGQMSYESYAFHFDHKKFIWRSNVGIGSFGDHRKVSLHRNQTWQDEIAIGRKPKIPKSVPEWSSLDVSPQAMNHMNLDAPLGPASLNAPLAVQTYSQQKPPKNAALNMYIYIYISLLIHEGFVVWQVSQLCNNMYNRGNLKH